MRVLVVEDDRALGSFLAKSLAHQGYDVEWVQDGDAAVERVSASRPDLMVLDLTLPLKDGVEVLAEVRDLAPQMAIMIVTSRASVEERIRCLDLGADDFLPKPFSFLELAARCRALLRRRERTAESKLVAGQIEMNLLDRTVQCGENELELTVKEFALLEYLMRKRGKCCDRSELLREVWRMHPDTSTNVVDVYINYLRKKLNAAGAGQAGKSLIETVRGAGYRFLETEEITPQGGGNLQVEKSNSRRETAFGGPIAVVMGHQTQIHSAGQYAAVA